MKRLFLSVLIISSSTLTACSSIVFEGVEDEDQDFPPIRIGRIEINETKYEIASGGFRFERKVGLKTEVVQTDHASPNQIAMNLKPISLKPDQKITVQIEENPKLTVYLWNENGREEQVKLHEDKLTAPSRKGNYIYEVFAEWMDGEISYTFVVEIK